ncbi:DsbA family protein [Candidatus Falkowbacteria bacterium]|nr:DsbA family protein [Candidatus Falkowbacteria bacterium]
MDEQKTNNKLTFFSGFFAGMAAVSVLGFIILLVIVFAQGTTDGTKAAGDEKAVVNEDNSVNQPVVAIKDSEYVRGNKDSKVEVIEYSDFECPFCLKHYATMNEVYKNYKDKAKFVFRHFPLSFHENAFKAAMAAECAGEQGKFWEMHDKAFDANQTATMSVDTWKAAAKKLGLDTKKFNACLDGDKYADKINNDIKEASAAGVSGTPATFINGEVVSGAYPYDTLKEKIEAALKQ